jgi:hypothetical protein
MNYILFTWYSNDFCSLLIEFEWNSVQDKNSICCRVEKKININELNNLRISRVDLNGILKLYVKTLNWKKINKCGSKFPRPWIFDKKQWKKEKDLPERWLESHYNKWNLNSIDKKGGNINHSTHSFKFIYSIKKFGKFASLFIFIFYSDLDNAMKLFKIHFQAIWKFEFINGFAGIIRCKLCKMTRFLGKLMVFPKN